MLLYLPALGSQALWEAAGSGEPLSPLLKKRPVNWLALGSAAASGMYLEPSLELAHSMSLFGVREDLGD